MSPEVIRRRVLVVGASFAGMSAAFEAKAALGQDHDVVVVSASREFVFFPSLIWLPFGMRERDELVFDVAPVLSKRGIDFVPERVLSLSPSTRHVVTGGGLERYDALILATGPRLDWGVVPGLGPKAHTVSIFTLPDAELARDAFEGLVASPGPVVVGAVQGAQLFGAAYEFALNLSLQLRKRGVSPKDAPITFVTPEPWVGHLGLGDERFGTREAMERLLKAHGIEAITNAEVASVDAGFVHLVDGRSLPQKLTMLTPPFTGVDAVRYCLDIVDDDGFVRVRDDLSVEAFPEVFAAGVAVSLPPRGRTKVPCGTPKTGMMSEAMGRIAGANAASILLGRRTQPANLESMHVPYVIDAGNDGLIVDRAQFLNDDSKVNLLPGQVAHWAKAAHARWFVSTRRRGIVG